VGDLPRYSAAADVAHPAKPKRAPAHGAAGAGSRLRPQRHPHTRPAARSLRGQTADPIALMSVT